MSDEDLDDAALSDAALTDPASLAPKASLDDPDYDEPGSGAAWVGLTAFAGVGIIGIVAVQVVLALAQGFILRPKEWGGIADDLFHRIGFPFSGLGSAAPLFLVVGAVLVAIPDLLGEPLAPSQDRTSGVALTAAVVLGVIVAIGSVLAARGSIQQYAARVDGSLPLAVMVQFLNSLLGSLGASALAIFAALGLRRLRKT